MKGFFFCCAANDDVFLHDFNQDLEAAVLLQCVFRGWLIRSRYKQTLTDIIRLQSSVRRHLQQRKYNVIKYKIIRLQSVIRMWLAWFRLITMLECVVVIQSLFRRKISHREYQARKRAVLVIQSTCRRYLAVDWRNGLARFAVITVQAFTRKVLQRRRYFRLLAAVIIIQSWWRGIRGRNRFYRRYGAVVAIQSFARMVLATRRTAKTLFSLITIQSVYRGHRTRLSFLFLRTAAIRIQCAYRRKYRREMMQTRWKALVHAARRRLLEQRQQAVERIQAFPRMARVRREYQRTLSFIVKIQALVRGLLRRRKWVEQLWAAVSLQAFSRAVVGRMHFLYSKAAAILIQSEFRRARSRSDYIVQYHAVIILQSFARLVNARLQFFRVVFAVIKIQATCKMLAARRRYSRVSKAVVLVQSVLRMVRPRRNLLTAVQAASLLAAVARGRRQVIWYQRLRACVCRLQKSVRRFLGVMRIYHPEVALHFSCRSGTVEVDALPPDLTQCSAWLDGCTLFHSLLMSKNVARMLPRLRNIDSAAVVETDARGKNSAHYLMQSGAPQVRALTQLGLVLDQYRHQREEELLEAFDEDEGGKMGEEGRAQRLKVLRRSVDDHTLKSGWLRKKRAGLLWQRRWMVLTEDYLVYHKGVQAPPQFAYPLDGCTVERVASRDFVIEMTAPRMGEKKSRFRASPKKSFLLQFDDESSLQQWLLPLRAVAGVEGGLRESPPVKYIHVELRELWVRAVDQDGNTPLHHLALNCATKGLVHSNSPVDGELKKGVEIKLAKGTNKKHQRRGAMDVVRVAAWLIARGCSVVAQNRDGDTALHLAVRNWKDLSLSTANGQEVKTEATPLKRVSSRRGSGDRAEGTGLKDLVRCLLLRGGRAGATQLRNQQGQTVLEQVEGTGDSKGVQQLFSSKNFYKLPEWPDSYPGAIKMKGYSYLSLYFGDCSIPADLKASGEEQAALVVSVFNHVGRLLEEPVVFRNPVLFWEASIGKKESFSELDSSSPFSGQWESCKQHKHHWGQLWHMQTPLENLDPGTVVRIELFECLGDHSSGTLSSSSTHTTVDTSGGHSSDPWVFKFPVNTSSINSTSTPKALPLLPDPSDGANDALTEGKVGKKSAVRQGAKREAPRRREWGKGSFSLDVDVELHRKERPVDRRRVLLSRGNI